MVYGLGALELFDDIYDIDTVAMTIYQPRRQNVSTFTLSKEELYRWADEVLKPTAELAFAGDGNFLCGEWCGFCKAKNDCRARAEANLELARYDFKLPPLLTDEDIEDILSRVDDLVAWASDITYEGVGATKKWERLDAYGPKFVENIVQATARDILCYAMRTLRCCSIVMHIHDELVIEADPSMSLDAVCEQMGRTPPWATGLLLRADGYATPFYKKD